MDHHWCDLLNPARVGDGMVGDDIEFVLATAASIVIGISASIIIGLAVFVLN